MFTDYVDDMFRLLNAATPTVNYPPYDIVSDKEGDHYKLTLAVAGFGKENLKVNAEGTILTISGVRPQPEGKDDMVYIHKGIAKRDFELKFRFADTLKITDASFNDGLLTVMWEKVPEEARGTLVPIN